MIGVTIKVRIVEDIIPPAMAIAIGCRLSPPIPKPMATGITPAMVETAVIKMGRNRIPAASMTPSDAGSWTSGTAWPRTWRPSTST